MKKLLLLIVAAIMLMIYVEFKYTSISASVEKKLIYKENDSSVAEVMPTIKVMTYNIHRGVNRDNELNLDGIVEAVKNSGAEIIALQEVERYSVRTKFQDQIRYIADKLSMQYVFGKSVNILNGQFGNAILSKYPIEEYEVRELPSEGENRTLLRAQLDVYGYKISFYNTHLGLKQSERDKQIEAILKIAGDGNNLILAGDFNEKVDKLGAITQKYGDCASFENNDSKATFENEGISERIDYIFTSKGFEVKSYNVPISDASDHYPVVSIIELKN
ncbi:MAG TPA: endonuclease/exonuclease/phosphatase family protein [Clostridia bacterium]|nr:endonuclease/exonuclease/phosphatase family protein [Clostridia bacterium]